MKISERWLREWVNPALDTEQLVARLTMAGLEVDGVEAAAGAFTDVVVAAVVSCQVHPDADKLSLCQVDDGRATHQVVCGAANVRAGLKVPFARIGAELGDDFTIKKAKLRGVESVGMLCSAAELGLVDSADGLLELPADAPLGLNLRDYLKLDDALIDIDLTPNRGDCLSICGLARELGALTETAVQKPAIGAVPATHQGALPVTLLHPEGCPRYLGRVIRNINQNVETPLWMQEKLRRAGLRSIDPVVDVTNYVLLELGQPMHAFDFDKLHGGIRVRLAEQGEALTLLDGKELKLNADTLVIADHEKAVAVAGIMGGKHSAVSAHTRHIFLESAFFNPVQIAGRARHYGLHTDASHRYERGVDFNLPAVAMERATALLLDIVGGEAGPVVGAQAQLPEVPPVTLRAKRIANLLGYALPVPAVEGILARLGFDKIATGENDWTYAVPSWRFDVSLEADLIEELARVHGYDKLPVRAPLTRLHLQPRPQGVLDMKVLRRLLVSLGYQEVVTYSFVDGELDAALAQEATAPVALANPISQDMAVMRSSLWPGLVRTLKHNQNRQQERCRLFESGLSFINKNTKLEQKVKVSSLLWGAAMAEQWGSASRGVDFFDLKGDVEAILALTHASESFRFEAAEHPALQPGQSARVLRGEDHLGWIGALHPRLLQALDITGKVFLMELDFTLLRASAIAVATELSRFPSVRRDLAFVLDAKTPVSAVEAQLRKIAGTELKELVLFDLYQGQNIEKDKKSLALGLTFQHASRTLTDLEINPIIDNCIKALQAEFNAELR
ncbi:MAG: phenylalanine--tRNA ligase subunit beta [Pseudomonadales bacterium]|jgi:phenylalanyl-tRNA synthetase beta chain|nr:phenylalanine--tRNA ligase subunit beta [Pseudomonadales bacterium]